MLGGATDFEDGEGNVEKRVNGAMRCCCGGNVMINAGFVHL